MYKGLEQSGGGGQKPATSEYHPQHPHCKKKLDVLGVRQISRFQKLRKQVSLFRSCTLCVQGSAQKHNVAEPPCRPPSLTLSVHSAREGPAPRVPVSSLTLTWALPCPLPGVSNPLGGVDALPCPSSCGDVTIADLVKPKAKRPRAAAWR